VPFEPLQFVLKDIVVVMAADSAFFSVHGFFSHTSNAERQLSAARGFARVR